MKQFSFILLFILLSYSTCAQKIIPKANYLDITNIDYSGYPLIAVRFSAFNPETFQDENTLQSRTSIYNDDRSVNQLIELNRINQIKDLKIQIFQNLVEKDSINAQIKLNEIWKINQELDFSYYFWVRNELNQTEMITTYFGHVPIENFNVNIGWPKLNELFRSMPEQFECGHNFLLIVVSDVDNYFLDQLFLLLRSYSGKKFPFMGIYYYNENIDLDNLPDYMINELEQYITFYEDFNDYAEVQKFVTLTKPLLFDEYLMKFNLNDPDSLAYKRSLNVSIDKSFNKIIQLDIPSQILNSYFINATIDKVQIMNINGNYKESILLLIKKYNVLPAPEFEEEGSKTCLLYGEHLYRTNPAKGFYDFLSFEKQWQHHKSGWYEERRLALLQKFYGSMLNTGGNYRVKYDIAKEMMAAQPSNSRYQLNMYEAYGDYLTATGELWNACTQYDNYLKIKQNIDVEQKMKINLDKLFTDAEESNDLKEVYANGKNYLSYYQANFKLRRILADACINQKDLLLALNNYKWLMNNWVDQQKLSWNDALWTLQGLYSNNLMFDNAIIADQRLYSETGDDKAIFYIVLNVRTNYCVPIAQAYKQGYLSFGNNNSDLTVSPVPYYITGAYTINKNTNAITTLVKNGNQNDISAVKVSGYRTYPTIVIDDINKIFYVVNQLADQTYFIMSINSSMSNEEKDIIVNIIGDKTNQEKWDRLIRSNAHSGAKFLSVFITRLMQNEYRVTGKISTESYWNSIKQNEFILYMVEHDKNGICAQYNFNKQNGNYEDIYWNKSSTTIAYFELEILYNDKMILDLTNPIMNNNRWERSIRIGINIE